MFLQKCGTFLSCLVGQLTLRFILRHSPLLNAKAEKCEDVLYGEIVLIHQKLKLGINSRQTFAFIERSWSKLIMMNTLEGEHCWDNYAIQIVGF